MVDDNFGRFLSLSLANKQIHYPKNRLSIWYTFYIFLQCLIHLGVRQFNRNELYMRKVKRF